MSTARYPGRPRVPVSAGSEQSRVEFVTQRLNAVIGGQLDATLSVTLDPGVASTVVNDSRVSFATVATLAPTTANAAAAASTTYWVPTQGLLTIHHANNAQTDRTFQLSLIG